MAEEPVRSSSWWTTLPGILTATAAVITAVTGLVAILVQNGVLGEKTKASIVDRAASVKEAVAPPTPTAQRPEAASVQEAVAPSATRTTSDAETGISAGTRATAFTGAVITLRNGSVVKLRDDIREYCLGRPSLKTTTGQLIEMARMRRFEPGDWRNGKGDVHITLNSGETIDANVEACGMIGSNDLGEYHGDFEAIRAVEFVR